MVQIYIYIDRWHMRALDAVANEWPSFHCVNIGFQFPLTSPAYRNFDQTWRAFYHVRKNAIRKDRCNAGTGCRKPKTTKALREFRQIKQKVIQQSKQTKKNKVAEDFRLDSISKAARQDIRENAIF